jgi:prevent-host-death family protein
VESIGAFEAKTKFSSLLERAKHGERMTITQRGKPVAMIVPFAPERSARTQDLVDRMRRLAEGQTLGDLDIKEMINSGRRF